MVLQTKKMGKEKGKFIVLEGQSYTGKSTQAQLLVSNLKSLGIKAIETQHPGGTPSTQAIREEISTKKKQGILSPTQEIDLFCKSAELLTDELVKPSLQKGLWVVSSRFWPSIRVYQGEGLGIGMDAIKAREELNNPTFTPDLYVLINLCPETILDRMKKADDRTVHSHDSSDYQILAQRFWGFANQKLKYPDEKWAYVSGDGTKGQVADRIWWEVKRHLLPDRF